MYRIDPWGDDWLQAARICQTVNNSAGGKGRFSDFWPGKKEDQSTDEMWSILMGLGADLEAHQKEKARRLGNERR